MIPVDIQRMRGFVALMPLQTSARFVGVDVSSCLIRKFLSQLATLEMGQEYSNNYNRKYCGEYHITLVSSVEFGGLEEATILEVVGSEVEVSLIGLGTASENSDCCFFVVCESEDLSALRIKMSLPPKDFHVTIGYGLRDLHDVSKGIDSLM